MLGKRIINTATGAAPSACTTDTVQILDGVPFQSIATYQLDGDANDLTTNHNGTWVGTEAYTTGQFGQAGVFNGSSSYIDTNISTITSNGGSVSLWVKTTTGTQSAFFGAQSPSQNRFYFGVRNNNFWMGAGSAQNSYSISASSLLDGNWHHVVLTLDGSTAKYYLDGNSTPVDTLSYTAAGTIGVTPLIGAIDALGAVSAYTNGSIDQVRIYNKALSADNVATLYAETVATASTNPTFNAPSLVAYYKMSDATDQTGSYDGTPTNVNFNVAGKFGNAGEFNGSSSKIITSADFDGSTSGGWSISFWFNTTQTTAKALFGSNTIQGGASQGSTVYLGAASGSIADESISFWDFNSSTTSVFYAKGGSTYYQDGNWHHCTIISSSSSKEIWIDGVSQTIYYYSSGSVSANAKLTDLTIGDDNTGGGFNFDGKIDQVRIFNRAITSNEVETLYDEVACPCTTNTIDYPTTNVAYYEFDGNADDSTTNGYNGTDTNVTWVQGRFGTAGSFNGNSSKITLPTSIKPADSIMSISLWVSNNSTARKSIFYLEYNNSNAFLSLENNSFVDSTALLVLYNNTAIITPANSALPTDGSWHHIVVTASATEVKLYKNGSQIGSTASITVNTNALTAAHIGVRDYNNDLYWDGKIDQVRIFNTALTSDQVTDLYDEQYCFDNFFNDDSTVATYKLNNTAFDDLGNYNGTASNVTYAAGKFDDAAVFNGNSSRIATGLTLPANSTMSFSFWLKSASNSSGNNYFLSDFDSSASNNSSRLSLAVSSSNGLRIWISNGSSNWNSTNDIDLSSYINVWMNLVVTIDGTDVKVYINGGTPTTLTSSVAFGTGGSRQQTIGRAGDLNGAYYEGSIDQVRIFDRALTAGEVTQLANE